MKTKRRISTLVICAIFLMLLTVGAVAAILKYATKSETSKLTKGEIFEIDLSTDLTAATLLPGDSININPVVTNDATSDMYVFIAVYTPVVGQDSIYAYNVGEDWSVVESTERKTVYSYSTTDEMTPLTLEEKTPALTSKMTLRDNISNAEFAGIDDINITITAYAVGTEDSPVAPSEAWAYCKQLGGIE